MVVPSEALFGREEPKIVEMGELALETLGLLLSIVRPVTALRGAQPIFYHRCLDGDVADHSSNPLSGTPFEKVFIS